MGLATSGKVLKDIRQDELLTEESFAPDTSRFVYKLRQMQDAMLAMDR